MLNKYFFLIFIILLIPLQIFSQLFDPEYLMDNNNTETTCAGYFYDSGGSGDNINLLLICIQGSYYNDEDYTKTFCSSNGDNLMFAFDLLEIVGSDYLNVYDGPNTASPLIYNLVSGSSVPTIISSGTCLTFVFHSGDNGTVGWPASCDDGGNFSATISCVQIYPINQGGTVTTCGGYFTDSGNMTGNYSANEDYTITFCPNSWNCVKLNFSQLNLGAGDQLEFFNGTTATGSPVATLTSASSIPPLGIGSDDGQCLTVHFTSDGATQGTGWIASVFCPPTCGTAPPCASNPAADNQCITATPLCNLEGFCGNTSSTYNSIDHNGEDWNNISGLMDDFCGSIENNSWLSFVAEENSATLNVWTYNCTNDAGIQMQIYQTADCQDFIPYSNCVSEGVPTDFVIQAYDLVPGQTYYLMVDGFGGDVCDYTISVGSGIAVGAQITPEQTICEGNTANISIDGVSSTGVTYTWSSNPVDASLQEFGNYILTTPLTTTDYAVTVTGPSANPLCGNINEVFYTTVNVVDNTDPACQENVTCVINPTISATSICEDEAVTLSATGDINITLMSNDFNNGNVGVGWASTVQATFTNPCGPGADGSTALWMGAASPAPRNLTSIDYNVQYGGEINFYLRYAEQGDASPCEGPDEIDEGITLQYSTNYGAAWSPIAYFRPSGVVEYNGNIYQGQSTLDASGPTAFTTWAQYTFAITGAAQTTNTRFRWIQEVSTDFQYDHWGLDSICISTPPPDVEINWTSNPAGLIYTGTNPPNQNPTEETTYYANISDNLGHSCVDSVKVTINPLPIPVITGTFELCNGSTTTLTSTAGSSYLWSNGANTQSITVNSSGTYCVTVTDANGCAGDTCVDVTYFTNPVANITGTLVFCTGDSTELDAGSGFDYLWSNSAITQTITVFAGGDYHVTITDSNNCTDRDTVTVVENSLPTPTITGTLEFCDGLSSTLDAGAGYNSYVWSPSGSVQTIDVTTGGAYAVTVTDANGCEGIDDVVVTVNPNPTANFTITQPLCYNSTGTVTFTGSSTGTTVFNWDFDGGVSVPGTGVGPHSVTWATSGSKTISVTVTDVGGCTNDTSFTTNVPNPLKIDSTLSVDVLCFGQSTGSISVYASGGTGQIKYSISGTLQLNGIFSNLAAGNYIVTISDANDCSITTNQITINQPFEPLSLSVNTGDSICAGNNYTIIANCSGGTQPYTYTWKNSTGNIVGGNNFSLTVAPNNTSFYSVNIVDDNNCTIGPVVSTLNVSPPVSISYTTKNVSCKGFCDGEVTFNISGGVQPFTFTGSTWTATQNTPYTKDTCAGQYIVNIKDSWGCPPKDTIFTITEPLALTYSTNSTKATCFATPTGVIDIDVTFGTGTPPYNYNWSNGGSTTDSLVAGVGRYYFTVTDANNCKITGSDSIAQPSQVKLIVSSDPVKICKGQSFTLDASNGAIGGTAPYTYYWTWVSPEDSLIHSNFNQSMTVSPTLTTSYTLSAKDFNYCFSSNSVTITVKVNPDITAEIFPATKTICPGDSIFVNTEISGGNGGPYLLTLQDGTIVTDNFYLYPDGQDTTINYIFTAKDLCGSIEGTDNFSIKIYALPPVTLSADTFIGCQPLKVLFSDSSLFIGQTYFWTFTNTDLNINSFSYSKNPIINFNEAGTYDVTIITTSIEGCKDSLYKEDLITVFPNPISEFTFDPQYQSKINPIFFFQNLSSTTYLSTWDFGDYDYLDNNFSNEINPSHTYRHVPNSYTVELLVETENGCKDSSNATIIVKDEYTFFAPTAFSPDNDGINDVFFVSGSGIDPKFFHLIIYDRWGEIIFETTTFNPQNPKQNGWNGKVKGHKNAEVGTYTWYCSYKNLNGEERQEAGPISILR